MIFVVLNSIFNSEADNPANGMFWQHFGLLGAVVTPPFAEHHSDISDLTQRGWFGCTLIKYPGAPFRPLQCSADGEESRVTARWPDAIESGP